MASDLAALGASSLQAADVPGITAPDAGKPWSISATIRGFYDDNINSAPDDQRLVLTDAAGNVVKTYERDSFGFEVSPTIAVTFPWEQTMLSLGYTYSFKYYENELFGSNDHNDQSHNFNLALNHAFSERYQLSMKDSFVIGQEPDFLRVGNTMETFQRIPGENMRNFGAINFDGQATRLLSYEVGYANTFFDYAADGATLGSDGQVIPSNAGLLNRLEHVIHLDSRWQMLPSTVGVVGYQFREVDYTGDEPISGNLFSVIMSDSRNARIHYGYVGADHTFRPDLTGSLRAGAQFVDYFNSPTSDTQIAPYVLASLKWTYMPESTAEVGFTQDINATDQYFATQGEPTLSAESSVGYLAIRHRITPKLFGGLTGSFQYSKYQGGALDGEGEWFYMAGVNLEYLFTPNFSAHVGYSYDLLSSFTDPVNNFDRGFDRNRVYIGLTARY